MKRTKQILVAIACTLALTCTSSQAEAKSKNIYKKIQVVDFQPDSIKGGLKNPNGTVITSRRLSRSARLFSLRKHWKKKAARSVDEL